MRAAAIDSVLRVPGTLSDGDVFGRAARLGLAGVEVELRRADLRSNTSERLLLLQRARRETGIAIPSVIAAGHIEDGGIADADPAVAREAAADVERAIAWAADLDADVVLVPFFLRSELVGEGSVERCVDAFRSLCRVAGPTGVTLCYEGTLPAADVRLLADRIGSDAFGCYFDVANAVVSGLDTATEIRRLRELVRRVHFKDARVRRGDCQPGLGRVDYGESAQALHEIGYDGWVVLETPPAPPEVVARDLSFARSVVPSLERPRAWPRLGAFTHELGVEGGELAGVLRELGLDTVQLSRALLDDFVAQPTARRVDVDVAAVGGYRNLIAPDAVERRANLEFIARCLELAPLLRTSIVTTHAGTRHATEEWADSPENRSEEAWRLLIDAVERLLPVATAAGTILAVEGSVKSVLRTVGQVLELLDRFPSPHLQLVCDPYNYLSSHLLPVQDRVTRDFLERFEHRFVVAHVKDVGPDGAEVSTPATGTGVFDQAPYMRFLRERRPDLPLILEHLTPDQVAAATRVVTSG